METDPLRVLPFLALGGAVLACSLFSPTAPASGTPAPSGPTPAASIVSAVPSVAPLTTDLLKNAQVQLAVQDAHPTIQLTNGSYQTGTSPYSPDYARVDLLPQMAFGDLNGDGTVDAAVLIAENYGGTGVFVSVIAMLNEHGRPVEAASALIDDRPKINSLNIQDGKVFVDAVIHGPNDPGCCAAWPTQRTLLYERGKLVMSGFSSGTPDGGERVITITHPSNGDQFMNSWPLTVTGQVSVTPLEKTLVYSIFDANENPIATGSLPVQAGQPGGPGFFSLPVDLAKVITPGPIRIQIQDSSAADGSVLALASVEVIVK